MAHRNRLDFGDNPKPYQPSECGFLPPPPSDYCACAPVGYSFTYAIHDCATGDYAAIAIDLTPEQFRAIFADATGLK